MVPRSNPFPLVGEGAERMLSSEAGEGCFLDFIVHPFTRFARFSSP